MLKGKVGEEKYGEKGKNGVIEITPKKGILQSGKSESSIVKPMIIINGKSAGSQITMKNIYSEAIKSMDVLKGKSATEKYGEDGKNGVIEITTDKPDKIFMRTVMGHPISPVPPVPTIEKKETSQDKVVNGWKVGAIPAERNLKEMLVEDKNFDYKNAVIIIDGKISNTKKMNKLNPDEIARIGVLKTLDGKQKEAWINKYGKKALNGVIEIETKGFSNQ